MFFPFFELCAILIQELTTLRSSLRVTSFLALTRCSFRSPSYLLVGRPCPLRAFNDTVISGFHSAAFFVHLSSQCAATLFFYPTFPSPARIHAILNIEQIHLLCHLSGVSSDVLYPVFLLFSLAPTCCHRQHRMRCCCPGLCCDRSRIHRCARLPLLPADPGRLLFSCSCSSETSRVHCETCHYPLRRPIQLCMFTCHGPCLGSTRHRG